MKKELIELIDVLTGFIRQLEVSGKPETAQYFQKILEQLNDDIDPTDALDRIINSGSVSQYAGLTTEDDLIFDQLHEKAISLKRAYREN